MPISPPESRIPIHLIVPTFQPELLEGLEIWLDLGLIRDVSIQVETNSSQISPESSQVSPLSSSQFTLNLQTQGSLVDLVAGLHAWEELGLLAQASVQVKVAVLASHPELLAGLDHWLNLGLLSPGTLSKLSQQYLTERVPETLEPAPAPSPSPQRASTATAPQPQPLSLLNQMTQSFSAELSVIWLLLLGVFMVVISSGVIAATQWQQFPPALQYGILFIYTLVFGAASLWMQGKPNLRLTAQALRVITLLLVPVNFFAIDGFRLWQTPLDWGVSAVAIVGLTAVTVYLFRQPGGLSRHRDLLLNHLGLSYLHLGWNLWGWELIAVYLGTVGTVILTQWHRRRQSRISVANNPPPLVPELAEFPISLNAALIIYALIILLMRAIFIAQVDVTQLGLALGICGALITAIKPVSSSSTQPRIPTEMIGAGFMGFGWLLSVGNLPWQALGVSGLGLWFCWRRLQVLDSIGDLMALFLIGWQIQPLIGRLFPPGIKDVLLQLGIRYSPPDSSWSLLGLAWFPYLVIWVALTEYLSKKERLKLAKAAGWIGLAFGVYLSVISLPSPAFRTLNLAGSTLLLAYLTHRQSHSTLTPVYRRCVYLTHASGALTLLLAINWVVPSLTGSAWIIVTLTLMIAEWCGLMMAEGLPLIWRRSCWYFGIGFAGLSYSLILGNIMIRLLDGSFSLVWTLTSLIIPGMLTLMAIFRPQHPPSLATESTAETSPAPEIIPAQGFLSWGSVFSLGATLLLLLWFTEGRWIGFGITLALMLVNTALLRNLWAAVITVGAGLILVIDILATSRFGLPTILGTQWLAVAAILTFGLWMLRHGLIFRAHPPAPSLAEFYAQALDYWAITGGIITLVFLDTLAVQAQQGQLEFSPLLIFSISAILMIATTYRSCQPRSQNFFIPLSLGVITAVQIATLPLPTWRVISLALAALLSCLQTYRRQTLWAATLTLGLTLASVFTALSQWVPYLTNATDGGAGWLLVGAITVTGLGSLYRGLHPRSQQLAQMYAQSADVWGFILCGFTLIACTLHSLFVYWAVFPATLLSILAIVLIILALPWRYAQQPSNFLLYTMGWAIELLLIEVLSLTYHSLLALSVANIILGIITQFLGDWWLDHHRQSPDEFSVPLQPGWNVIPLVYGALGAALRGGSFTSWTGLTTLGLVVIAVGVGRRSPRYKSLIYLAMVGVAASAYEILFYQIADLPSGSQWVAVATLTTSFLYAYQLLAPWLTHYLSLSLSTLKLITHLHWGLGSVFLLTAIFYPITLNSLIGLTTGILLTRYALWQGRRQVSGNDADVWIYLGVLEGVGIAIYALTFLPDRLLGVLLPWMGALTGILAYFIYILPWSRWGWPGRPWRISALALPILAVIATSSAILPMSLFLVAGFYGFLAYSRHQVRLSYWSLLLIDWGIIKWAITQAKLTPMGIASLIGFSLLYLAQVDPSLKQSRAKEIRHWIRCLGAGIICGYALWQHSQTGILPGTLSLIAIFVGLGLRIRAFLYVGTLIFSLNAFYQLVILVFSYPLIKWLIGLLVGIGLIGLAATFERSREQMNLWLRNWMIQLREWQ